MDKKELTNNEIMRIGRNLLWPPHARLLVDEAERVDIMKQNDESRVMNGDKGTQVQIRPLQPLKETETAEYEGRI